MLQIRLTGTLIKRRNHPRVHAERQLRLHRILSNLSRVCPSRRLLFKKLVVNIHHSAYLKYRFMYTFLSYTITGTCITSAEINSAGTGKTCECVRKAQAQRQWTTHYQLSLGSHMAQIWPQSHMLKGSKAQMRRRNHRVTGWENKGEAPHKYVYFHPEAEGVAQRADPKEKPSLLGSVT